MTRFLPLFALAVMAIVGASNAQAQTPQDAMQNAGDGTKVWTTDSSGNTVRVDIPPECQPGGTLMKAQEQNSAVGYIRSKVRVENAFRDAVPKPAAAYNCLSSIFNIFRTLSSFSWPPNLGSLFSGFIDMILKKACSALWNAVARSSFVANYNSAVGSFNMAAGCTNDLTTCRPIAEAKNGIMGEIEGFF